MIIERGYKDFGTNICPVCGWEFDENGNHVPGLHDRKEDR
jgi:hypothetical protein